MAVLRAREAIILRSIRHESRIRQVGRRIHKRFRSWTQQRTRKYWMPQKVSLHAPVDIMDSWSISAAVQKAATIRKHDSHMWYNFSKRVIELAPTLCPQQMGYVYYGYGKSRFYNQHFYEKISEYSAPLLSKFPSSSLMCVVWCLSRLQLRQVAFLSRLASVVADKFDSLRTTDLMKICDGLARLDITTPYLKQQIADKMIGRLDSLYAQDFRNAMNDVTLFHMYDENTQIYIMERFPRIFICARSNTLRQALSCALVVRVMLQNVWLKLNQSTRNFYTRLSTRTIQQSERSPSLFHWDVSSTLAELGIQHRNTFYWGCYWIDVGEVRDRQNCWFVDGPCCFYSGTTKYTNKVKLQHSVLKKLGWNIRRIPWFQWVDVMRDQQERKAFVKYIRERQPQKDLVDDEALSCVELKEKLNTMKQLYTKSKRTLTQLSN